VADHLGKTTHFFLGYRCPTVHTASPCTPGTVVHQTALYDFFSSIVLLPALLLIRRRPRYDSFLILVFGAWYGAMRIVEDFLREDTRHFGLTGSQWTAIATVAICLAALLFLRRTPRWGRWDERDQPPGPRTLGGVGESRREDSDVDVRIGVISTTEEIEI